jgi:hypothetical protein
MNARTSQCEFAARRRFLQGAVSGLGFALIGCATAGASRRGAYAELGKQFEVPHRRHLRPETSNEAY